MWSVCRKFLLAVCILGLFWGCEEKDSVAEDGTVVDIVPEEEEAGADPDTVVCSPFDETAEGGDREQGILGSLYYRRSDQPQWSSVHDYIDQGEHLLGIDLYFNQLWIPTRPFDRGFVTSGGRTLMNAEGNTLYEWFALRFEGRLHLNSSEAPGLYQLAVLSDDGAVLSIDRGDGTYGVLIDNDGNHPTKLGCASEALEFAAGEKIPYILDYHQGPRYHIAMTLMWRPWPSNPADVADPLCGREGNSLYFDSTQDPPAPQPAFQQLLDRGWKVLEAGNYSLPKEAEDNPCNEPAPEISGFAVASVSSTSVTLTWTTDRPATSQVSIVDGRTGVETFTTEVMTYTKTHSVTVSGLKADSVYGAKAISRSVSRLSSQSGQLLFRTRR